MLKVSVVIPVYNPGEYFTPCIESLTSQSLAPDEFEVICVDDGSTDDTPARLDELAAMYPNIRVIHQPNSGWPGQPRNVGLDAARGEYVFFCDHDDWLGIEALERLHAFATSCGSDIVLPKMAGLRRAIPRHVFRETIRHCSVTDSPIMDSLTPHKLFRREFLEKHNIRFPEGQRRLEDHLFVVTGYLWPRWSASTPTTAAITTLGGSTRPTQASVTPTGGATSTIWRRPSTSSWHTAGRRA